MQIGREPLEDLSPLWCGTAIGRVGPFVVMEGINEEEEGSRVSGSEPEQYTFKARQMDMPSSTGRR